jgi:ABC-type Mn2+/Zn2+ transport system ATPase subunit
MNGDLAIDVKGMTKRFGTRTVVNGIDLQVRSGEIYGFLGPNGSGKTTFIRMLCGLLKADGGSGTCLGFDVIRESEAIKKQVGYMTQRFSFWKISAFAKIWISSPACMTSKIAVMSCRNRSGSSDSPDANDSLRASSPADGSNVSRWRPA